MSGGAVLTGHVVDGDRVRELRRALCLTQEELGARTGTSQRAISLIERGRAGRPGCLAELAAIFGVPTGLLLKLPATGAPQPAAGAAEPAYWSVPEAAAQLGMGRGKVYALVRAGVLPARHAGRSVRIAPAAVRAYLDRPAPPPPSPVAPSHLHPAMARAGPQQLRTLREAHGWTRLELASRAGVSLATVSALETGHRTMTSALPALARALGTHPSGLQAPTLATGPPHPGTAASRRLPGRPRLREPGPYLDGARLATLRATRGLTQAQLARAAGLNRPMLSMLERGHLQRSSVIPALAAALGVQPCELAATTAPATPTGHKTRAPPHHPRSLNKKRDTQMPEPAEDLPSGTGTVGSAPAFVTALARLAHHQ